MPIANPYIVVVQSEHPRSAELTEYRVPLEAYSITDAMTQALVELDAKYALFEQQYKVKVLSVIPDTAKSIDRLTDMLKDIGLLKLPTTGRKA